MKNKTKKKSLRTLLFVIAAAGCLGAAACAKEKLTLSFAVNGGADIAAAEVKKGEEYSLPTPTREGYEFEGWYATEDFSGDPVEKITDVQENYTFYAKWAKVQTITLNANGGTLSATTVKAKVGANLSEVLASYVPEKTGYVFGAWFGADGKEISKTAVVPDSDLTLTAKYKVGYTVEIYRQNLEQTGYEKDEQPLVYYDYEGVTVNAEEKLRGFTEVAKEGESGTLASIKLTGNAADNVMRLYFDRKTFTITYKVTYPDGSGKTQSSVNVLYGKKVQVPCDYKAEGYLLTGWSKREGGEAEYFTDTMKHCLYGEKDAETETSDEIAPEESVNLYAVWEKGYTDMFGGYDALYLFDKEDSKIYMHRGGVFFEGKYYAKSSNFEFGNVDGEVLNGKLVGNGAFVYLDGTHVTERAVSFKYATGKTDESTWIAFNDDNTLLYVKETAERNYSSSGTYVPVENGNFEATFTDGELKGKSLTFFRGKLSNGDDVFVQRNDEEICSMYRHIVNGSSLVQSSLIAEGYFELKLDGFGIASLNTGTTADPQISQFYYTMENREITLYNSYRSEQGVIRVFDDDNGKTGWMFYNSAFDRTIVAADGSAITMDGVCNLTYKDKNGTETLGYYATSSTVLGTLVGMNKNDKAYRFLVTSYSEEVLGDDGKKTTETKYNFVAKSDKYAEYYFQSNAGTMYGPLLVIDDDGAGTASIYEYISATKTYSIASKGTYTYDEKSGLYTYTAKESHAVDGGTGAYNIEGLTTAVFRVDTESTAYSVYYWNTVLDGETWENYEKSYVSADGKATLKKVGSIMRLDNDGIVTSGTFATNTKTNVTTITNGKENKAYVRIDEKNGTFEVLWTSPYSSYLVDEKGKADTAKYITFDGTGSSKNGGATYTVVTGSGESRVTTTYTGKFTETDETDSINTNYKVCVFTGTTEGNKPIEFKFLRVRGSSSITIYTYNNLLNGEYTSASEGSLKLDGFGLMAEYTAPNGAIAYGVYALADAEKNILQLYTTAEELYYFDLSKEGESQTFTLRGNEYGTPYYFVDNQQLTGFAAEMDGHGKLSIIDVEKSTSTETSYAAEGIDYTKNNGEFTFTWEYKGETKTVTGVLRGLSTGNSKPLPCFIIYQEETVAVTYINPDDYSLMVLDRLGNATIYSGNKAVTETVKGENGESDKLNVISRPGDKVTGSYTLISENLFYYVNSNGSDASLYRYDSARKMVVRCVYGNAFSYYASDLSAMLFTKYGLAAINGVQYFYERTETGIDMYRRTNAEDSNKYGFKPIKNLLTFDESGDTPATMVYEGREYFKNDGFNLAFERGGSEAEQKYYPITFSDVGDKDGKVPIKRVTFAPTGTAEFSVSGTVYFTYHKQKKVQKTDEKGNPITDEKGNPVYEIVPGEATDTSKSCTVSRVALKDADGNPLLDSEGKQKYQMYLTFGSFRFDISVDFRGTGDGANNTYSVSGLNFIQSYSSFNYKFYKALSSMTGGSSPIEDPGTLSIQINFDQNGDETYRHIVSAFTKESGYADSEGNLFEIDCEYTMNGKTYNADFTGKDGKNYRLYMQPMSQYGISGYSMMITRIETLKDGKYTVAVERLAASDSGYSAGSYVSFALSEGEGEEKTEYKADTIFRTSATAPWTYVVREYNENKRITSTKYFEITLTEKSTEIGDTGIAFFESVKVTEKAVNTYYTESGKNDGKSFVDIGADGVKLLVLNGTGYVISESAYEETTGVYTATASSGKKFSVKVTGDTAEITEIVEGNE